MGPRTRTTRRLRLSYCFVIGIATVSPQPFPPTYAVPGGSVFNAFYKLIELVSSTYPFTGTEFSHGRVLATAEEGHAGEAPPDAAASDLLDIQYDPSKSLYTRSRDAARMLSDLVASGAALEVFKSKSAWDAFNDWMPSSEGGASAHGRKLVGGGPVRNADSPAALFCDSDNVTRARLSAYHQHLYHTRRRRMSASGVSLRSETLAAELAEADGEFKEAYNRDARRCLHGGDIGDTNSSFDFLLSWPFARYAVEEWCTIARLEPHVLAALGFGDPKTLFIPDFFAFLTFNEKFPAWFEWMHSLPQCVSSFNRAEFFLFLHATWRRVSCSSPSGSNRSFVDFPSAALPRVGARHYYAGRDLDARPYLASEKLRLGRVVGSHVTNVTTCKVDTKAHFDFHCDDISPNVRAQFIGRDGNILLLDNIIKPSAEPLMRFPSINLIDFILGHPHMKNFSCLLVRTGLAPFLALAPLYNEQLLSFLGSQNNSALACLCRDILHAPVSATTCRAILRFLYNLFHSVTAFVPTDDAFARLPAGVLDYLTDPDNVDLARYVVLTHLLHGQTYLYDCSLADVLRNWKRVDQRTASNSIVTISVLVDTVVTQPKWTGHRRVQAAPTPPSSWNPDDPDASTRVYTGWAAGQNPAEGGTNDTAPVQASHVDEVQEDWPHESGANIVRGGRNIQLLLFFNNEFNPSPYSARTTTTNFETTTGIVHKIDGVLLDGCASGSVTGGLYGTPDGGASLLGCQCGNGNPFPLACSASAFRCPADGNTTAGDWPWRLGIADGAWDHRCSCPLRPWDTVFVDENGELNNVRRARRRMPWHTLSEELLEEALAIDHQWQVTQLLQEWSGFRRILMAASEGSDALKRVREVEARIGVVAKAAAAPSA